MSGRGKPVRKLGWGFRPPTRGGGIPSNEVKLRDSAFEPVVGYQGKIQDIDYSIASGRGGRGQRTEDRGQKPEARIQKGKANHGLTWIDADF